MKISFWGAARNTTGSLHRLTVGDYNVILDCGLNQGKRKEAFEMNRNLPFDGTDIDACVLSHAHIDHSGNLPSLVKSGFGGKIYATSATCDLCDIMLKDSAYLQTKDVEYVNKKRVRDGKNPFEPLYEAQDVEKTLPLFSAVPYENPIEIAPGLKIIFHDAGHILGSALVEIEYGDNEKKKRLLFTGDMGRKNMPILRDPVIVRGVDYLITESTYGNRVHPPEEDVKDKLASVCDKIVQRNSRLIIPAFSVGRTQQVLYFLNRLYNEDRLGEIPVYVDSPLSTKATKVYESHDECYDHAMLQDIRDNNNPFTLDHVTYVTDTAHSKELNSIVGPVIIISASGMCEGGRIQHHLKNSVGDDNNIILIVGYQAENTLGRRILNQESPIKIFGEKYDLNAEVHSVQALSAHADSNEMLDYFAGMGTEKVKCAFIVHGEPDQQEPFSQKLQKAGVEKVLIPERGQTFDI